MRVAGVLRGLDLLVQHLQSNFRLTGAQGRSDARHKPHRGALLLLAQPVIHPLVLLAKLRVTTHEAEDRFRVSRAATEDTLDVGLHLRLLLRFGLRCRHGLFLRLLLREHGAHAHGALQPLHESLGRVLRAEGGAVVDRTHQRKPPMSWFP